MPPEAEQDGAAERLARDVARQFRRRMLDEYVPRIRRCTELLSEEQAWTRPAAHGNSVANLLLHLAGNTRQWILCGLGGEPDRRERASEFAATAEQAAVPVGELMRRLEETVRAAVAIVERLGPDELLRESTFQGRYRESGLAAVLHVLEHFSGHAAQIYQFTKQVTGQDLRFYDL